MDICFLKAMKAMKVTYDDVVQDRNVKLFSNLAKENPFFSW